MGWLMLVAGLAAIVGAAHISNGLYAALLTGGYGLVAMAAIYAWSRP